MRPGNHAAGDGSFGRSAGVNVGKALVLVVVAVAIGGILLRHNRGTVTVAAAGGTSTSAKPVRSASTTTTAPARVPPTQVTPTTTGLRPPSAVKVLVANGTSVGGAASRFSDKLHGGGYNTLAATNTTARGVASTVVYYGPGFKNEAAGVAQQLGLPASAAQPVPAQAPVASLNGANILVIVGQDLAGSAGSAGSGGTTATTARHAVTTTIKH